MNYHKDALADYDKAITLKPDYADAYNNRGILRSEMGDQAGALADYDKAIILKSDYADAYCNRGVLNNNMGNRVDALTDYNKAISLKPDYVSAYDNRADCYRKLAEAEQDPAKKADLIAKAEADEKKAESLKKEDKA